MLHYTFSRQLVNFRTYIVTYIICRVLPLNMCKSNTKNCYRTPFFYCHYFSIFLLKFPFEFVSYGNILNAKFLHLLNLSIFFLLCTLYTLYATLVGNKKETERVFDQLWYSAMVYTVPEDFRANKFLLLQI